MPNVAKLLKEEIERLARKEIRKSTDALHKENLALRRTLAELKRRLDAVEKAERKSTRVLKEVQPKTAAEETAAEALGARFSGKTIRNMRQKWNITQGELALLAGVSSQAVYQWERKEGRLRLRNSTLEALAALRPMGVREVRKRIEEATANAPAKAPVAPEPEKPRRKRRAKDGQ